MAGVYTNRADPLTKRETDAGYRVAWKLKYGFQKGHLDGEMTYGAAKKKAAELEAKDKEKVYWAEMIMDANF